MAFHVFWQSRCRVRHPVQASVLVYYEMLACGKCSRKDSCGSAPWLNGRHQLIANASIAVILCIVDRSL
jgi:hypothetical protein